MEAVERARKLLEETRRAPRMFASTKEALLSRCSTVLEMLGIEGAGQAFYLRHLYSRASVVCGLEDPVDDEWAEAVILDALSQLP